MEEGGGISFILVGIVAAVLFIIVLFYSMIKRYKRCPSDQILVIFGKVGAGADGFRSAKCIHGGAAFIWPVIQDYAFLELKPISIEVKLTNALFVWTCLQALLWVFQQRLVL
jgi:flotillin